MVQALYDVIVVGAGASGMMAAGRAAMRGQRVLLLEKNARIGAKLGITGGGRCNVTNAEDDIHVLLAQYGEAKDFLHSPFSQFGVRDAFEFFQSRGLPLVVQARKRVFPQTEKAEDVVRVMERFCREGGVTIRTGATVERINILERRIRGVVVDGDVLTASSYILATGGLSHPETGSTGDGFSWLSLLGHQIQAPTPTIVPLAVQESWVKQLAGVTLPDVRVSVLLDGTRKFILRGDVLCTHFGLSGPLILNAAGGVADLLHEGMVTFQIDAYPHEDVGVLDRRLTAVFDEHKNKDLKNIWNEFAPLGTAHALMPLLRGIDRAIKVHSITRDQRRQIVDLLKALPVTITGLMGYDRAVVADGGLSLSEVDTRTMRSKQYPNLFVTGDLLHISRPSGGYSLQLCWTTGWVAGTHA
jgi:predicted Rossmann fold flavoprotein